MMPSGLAEIEIEIFPRGGEYGVRLKYRPAGSAGSTDPLRGKGVTARIDLDALRAHALDPVAYGDALARALFADRELEQAFREVLANAADDPLRVRLSIDGGASELNALRWELMHEPGVQSPLFVGQRRFFSRYSPSSGFRRVQLRHRDDLRALIVVANPTDLERWAPNGRPLPPIDVAAEVGRAQTAFQGIHQTTLANGRATFDEITRQLQQRHDILYLVCHGALVAGEARLWLEGADGTSHVVPGQELVQRIQRLAAPPLLALVASCHTADRQISESSADDAPGSFAAQLAAAGVPAVIAMQGAVSMATMATLIPELFRELFADAPVDLALATARQAVSERPDWWMPALCMSLDDGMIWHQVTTTYKRISNLRTPPADFTGRADELERVLRIADDQRVLIIALRGLGGIGKTALALAVANQLTPRYRDAAIELNLLGATPSPVTPRDAQIRVIRAFDQSAVVPNEDCALGDLYRATLRGRSGLLVLDDARDLSQVRPLLPPDSWGLIVTSRQHFPLDGLRAIDLNVMTEDDARALLQKIEPRVSNSQAEVISVLCGRLPLALRLAGSYLQTHPDEPVDVYIRRLSDEEQRIRRLDLALRLDPGNPGIQASLELSHGMLEQGLQRRLRELSVFPSSFDARAAAAVWELAPLDATSRADIQTAVDDATESLQALAEYSLLEADEDERFYLQSLVRLMLGRLLSAGERAVVAQRHAEHYLGVLKEVGARFELGGAGVMAALSLGDLEWSNIRAGQAWVSSNTAKGAYVSHLAMSYPLAAPDVTGLRLHGREAIEWFRAAVTAARAIGDRPGEGAALVGLANAVLQVGEPERAVELYEQGLSIRREVSDRRGEGEALTGLANGHAGMGNLHRAIELYQQALPIRREIGDRRGEARTLTGLANRHHELGEFGRAIELYELALSIQREIEDQGGEGAALTGLASSHVQRGETPRAVELYEQRLVLARKVGDRRGEGAALAGLAYCHARMEDPRRAIELYEQSLSIRREVGDRRSEGATLAGLARCHVQMEDPRRAIDLYEQALLIQREVGDQRSTGASLTGLANCYVALGEPSRAIKRYQQAVEIDREVDDRQSEGTNLFNLSLVQEAVGDMRLALESAEASLRIREAIEDPQTVSTRGWINMLRERLAPNNSTGRGTSLHPDQSVHS